MLVNCTNTILDFYARAFYHEHPIKDDEGNLIGHEWYGVRSGGGQVWFNSVCAEDNELSTTQYLTMGCEHKQKREEKIW